MHCGSLRDKRLKDIIFNNARMLNSFRDAASSACYESHRYHHYVYISIVSTSNTEEHGRTSTVCY